jgi:acyl dehydratase
MDNPTPPLYFEDLTVGRVFRSGELEVTADAIKEFATKFDPQKFHLSETEAVDTVFGELVASGWHTTAMSMRLLVDGEMRLAGGIVGASMDELRWPRPTRPGDRLSLESEIIETRTLKSRPSHGIARVKMTTTNQEHAPVLTYIASLIVPRRTPA